MGFTSYSTTLRSARAETMQYKTKSFDEVFTQQKEHKAHETMTSKGMSTRECCDSKAHPNTLPIILTLDVTGSMGKIPHMLIKDGLPSIMSTIIDNGVVDASLLFMAVGDHECDRHPLQVGQFESGDEELDMWLTRTYVESGGGANAGESYHLAWLAALNHVRTDAWDKRGKKGVLFTIGDEPILPVTPKNALKEVFGEESPYQDSINTKDLLDEVNKKWDVYHIHINHGSGYSWTDVEKEWRHLLGQRLITTDDYNNIPKLVSEIVLQHNSNTNNVVTPIEVETPDGKPTSIVVDDPSL